MYSDKCNFSDVDRKDNIDILDAVEEVSGDEDADYTEYMTGIYPVQSGSLNNCIHPSKFSCLRQCREILHIRPNPREFVLILVNSSISSWISPYPRIVVRIRLNPSKRFVFLTKLFFFIV